MKVSVTRGCIPVIVQVRRCHRLGGKEDAGRLSLDSNHISRIASGRLTRIQARKELFEFMLPRVEGIVLIFKFKFKSPSHLLGA